VQDMDDVLSTLRAAERFDFGYFIGEAGRHGVVVPPQVSAGLRRFMVERK
jgi:hypothetical protein